MASTESECTTTIECLQEGWQTMRMTFRGMVSALLLAGVGIWASAPAALAQKANAARSTSGPDDSYWRLPAVADFPIKERIVLALGKSFLLEFPFELKDVVVS